MLPAACSIGETRADLESHELGRELAGRDGKPRDADSPPLTVQPLMEGHGPVIANVFPDHW